jgi:hypothetical protein
MTDNDIDLRSFSIDKKDEDRRMLDYSIAEDYVPIQKNSRLFKFILYTSKFEIKSNSLIKMIYTTSLCEFALWIIGLLIFLSSPRSLYLIWVLIIHIAKSILGFILLHSMPKTYEIIENVAKNPNFEEDKIIDLIQSQIRETFVQRWTDNKHKLLSYLISTIISFIIDIVIFIVQICVFGNPSWFLMQTSLLLIMLVFIGN